MTYSSACAGEYGAGVDQACGTGSYQGKKHLQHEQGQSCFWQISRILGTIRLSGRNIAYFGLPGNPMACVACFRFFVVPYLRVLRRLPPEVFETCRVTSNRDNATEEHSQNWIVAPPSKLCTFRLAVHVQDGDGRGFRLVENQGSHKIKPLLDADCWVIIPPSSTGFRSGDVLQIVPSSPGGADFMQDTLGMRRCCTTSLSSPRRNISTKQGRECVASTFGIEHPKCHE